MRFGCISTLFRQCFCKRFCFHHFKEFSINCACEDDRPETDRSSKAKLDIVNPVLENGRRKYKIHQMLSYETKQRLSPHVTSVLILMKSANSLAELRRLVQRQYGVDQPNLFDGWDVK